MRISDWSSDVCSSDLVDGTAPRSAPRIQINAAGDGIARDAHGNALGGIRTPYVDVPTAVLSGENASTQGDGGICFLVGKTQRFDAATLASLYPDRAAYIAAVRVAAQDAEIGRAACRGRVCRCVQISVAVVSFKKT